MTTKIITHLICGYPNIKESENILTLLGEYSEYIEVQFPFSDPIADGPIISKANEVALENGITTKDCFTFIKNNSKKIKSKILIMTYFNIVYNFGIENFIKTSKKLGVYGFIIPDLPYDTKDSKKMLKLCKKHKVNFIQLVSPEVKKDRLKKISKLSKGFVYAVSQNMTTGSKASFGKDFIDYINSLRKKIKLPIGVGFGIKTKQDIEKVCKTADFAIIGSSMIKVYNEGGIKGLKKYIKELGLKKK